MLVDRKDNSIGYVNDNVVLCLTAVNKEGEVSHFGLLWRHYVWWF